MGPSVGKVRIARFIMPLMLLATLISAQVIYHFAVSGAPEEYPEVTFWEWSTGQKKNTFDYSVTIFPSVTTIDENVTHGIFNDDTSEHICDLRISSITTPTNIARLNVTIYNSTTTILTKEWTNFSPLPTAWEPFTTAAGKKYSIWIEIKAASGASGSSTIVFELKMDVKAGLLKIETNPPVPATLYIGGTSVDPWGLDYLPLHPANYKVRFGDIPYYVTPPSQNVTLNEEEVATVVGAYVKAGLLKIETNPPVPANLYVDGVARDVWGLDYLPVTPGNHTVRFGDVPYYVTPPSQNVTIQADEVKVVVGNYVKAGLLKVETSPPVPGVIYVNGTARAAWGLDYLPVIPSIYNVSFGNVNGYVTPQPQIVSVFQDQVTTVVGNYIASEVSYPGSPHGFLKIETDPPMPATLYLDDVPVDPWGLDYLPLPRGVYRIRFGDVPYYVTPPDQVAAVEENQTTVVVGVYIKAGLLKIDTSPPLPVTLYLDGKPVATWGLDYMPLPPGDYIIRFGDAPEYVGYHVTPPEKTVTIIQDQTTVVVGQYIRAGLLKVETNPAVPSVIYVNGTARAVWGLDYLPLAPGTYLVSFGEVPDFVTPPVQIITIEEDNITVVVGYFGS